MPVLHAKDAMWSRKQSVSSAVSGASRGEDPGSDPKLYPFAVALRVRVLQIVCGIGGLVVGAVGWLEERERPALGLGVPTGVVTILAAGIVIGGLVVGAVGLLEERERPALGLGVPTGVVTILAAGIVIGGLVVGAVGWLEERERPALGLGVPTGVVTILAAATSVYYSRGFGGWVSARAKSSGAWGAPWRALGPSPCAAVPLTALWAAAAAAHVAMITFCVRSLLNIGCGTQTCVGVAGAQLCLSLSTLAAQVFMLQLDLRRDAAVSPPRRSDAHATAVSMVCQEMQVPLTSVGVSSGGSSEPEGGVTPQGREKSPQPPPEPT
ncbi:unnamed protein product [Plutella xylostella]|uniref:(diamondback moth) hypothetical protein n=1 Tax=Plutella xylostella TaxID=51655 RepID=A0A8S4G8I0_PLUXY|nr:unnamed protein product [Plutella xylostella]